MNVINMVSYNGIKLNQLDGESKWRWYKTIYTIFNGACTTTNLPDIDALLISYEYNSYLDYNAIEYLDNNSK